MKNVKVYTTAICPFCLKAKELLKKENITFEEIDITHNAEKRIELERLSKIRTVPQIFVNDKFVGDCNQIYQFHREGSFDQIFK